MMHIPFVFSLVLSSAPFASATPWLENRAAQSEAVCTTDFAWMDNSNHQSPCQVASSVSALCNSGNWFIPKLNASFNYDNPTIEKGTATLCTCSWAAYNLMGACTVCQGFQEKVPSFSPYVSGCVGKLSNTYFPTNLTLPQDVLIPAWAGRNPTEWTNQIFSWSEAKGVADQGLPDLGNSPPASKKSKPIGAIVGGVIGGLIVIAGAIAVAFYILRRQRMPGSKGASSLVDMRAPHMRSTSDVTTHSGVKSIGAYTTLSSTPMVSNPPTSPSILTHGASSVRSMPMFNSVIASTAPYGSPSPPPVPSRQVTASPPQNREDIIVPFTLPPTNDNPDRKQANGAYPIYDPPSAPPPNAMRMEVTHLQAPPPKTRYNPPAYTETSPGDTSGSASGSRHRGKQGSTDTNHSTPSNRTGAPQRQTSPAHTPANSGSSMGQMGVANATISNTLSNTAERGENRVRPQEHGRHLSGNSRDEKRQPAGEFSASDIA